METPQPDQELHREIEELRSWGTFEGTKETVTNAAGRVVEEIAKDADGTVTSHAHFIRDSSGRLQEELWEERTDAGGTRRGKYRYVYDEAGNQIDKIWQLIEE